MKRHTTYRRGDETTRTLSLSQWGKRIMTLSWDTDVCVSKTNRHNGIEEVSEQITAFSYELTPTSDFTTIL